MLKKMDILLFTTLLVSPYQNHDALVEVAKMMAKKYDIEFLYRDFRVGFREGQAKARELGLYMQKYCGCIFSEEDRYSKQIKKDKENIKDITKIMLKQFAKRVKNQMDMELCIADDVVDFISDKGFDKDYGARPIRRALQTELEDVLAEAVLMEDISIGDTVDVSLSCEGTKKKIVVKKKTFADEKK